jgi:hypothetical protein
VLQSRQRSSPKPHLPRRRRGSTGQHWRQSEKSLCLDALWGMIASLVCPAVIPSALHASHGLISTSKLCSTSLRPTLVAAQGGRAAATAEQPAAAHPIDRRRCLRHRQHTVRGAGHLGGRPDCAHGRHLQCRRGGGHRRLARARVSIQGASSCMHAPRSSAVDPVCVAVPVLKSNAWHAQQGGRAGSSAAGAHPAVHGDAAIPAQVGAAMLAAHMPSCSPFASTANLLDAQLFSSPQQSRVVYPPEGVPAHPPGCTMLEQGTGLGFFRVFRLMDVWIFV